MEANAQAKPTRAPLTALVYGLGSVAFGVKDQGFAALLMLFYNQVLGLRASVVGSAIMIALVADAFIDPLVGHLSDNWRSAWGRRHPFMYAAVIPACLSYLAIWSPPAEMSEGECFAFLLVTAIVIRTFISCYEVPSAALGPELTRDYDQRTSLLSVRFFFGWLGGLGMGIAAFRVFLTPDATHPVGQLNRDGYTAYAITAASVIAGSMLISALGTHRYIPTLAAPPPARPFALSQFLGEARGTLRNRAFVTILCNGACGAMSFGIVTGMNVYISTYFWELTGPQIGTLMLGNLISAGMALVIAPRLSRRFEKKKALIAALAALTVLGPAPVLLRLAGVFALPKTPALMPLLFLSSTVTTMFSITASILSTSMMADLVEDAEVRTGRRSEGLIFSAAAFTLKCVSGVSIGAAGLILSLAHFPAAAVPGKVPMPILQHLVGLQIGLTAACNLLAIGFAAAYPITKAMHEANLRALGGGQRAASDSDRVLAAAERVGIRSSMRPGA